MTVAFYVFFALLISNYAWALQISQDSVAQIPAIPVTQAITSWVDVLRLYVFPAIGALLMGVVAIILEKIRKVVFKTVSTVAGVAEKVDGQDKTLEAQNQALRLLLDAHNIEVPVDLKEKK